MIGRATTAWVELIPLSRCRAGGGTFVAHGGRELAVFVLGDEDGVVVIDNSCPHASGNLSGGEVAGTTVQCPWHHWEFDLRSGRCTTSDRVSVRRYPAEVRGDAVWADLNGSLPSALDPCADSCGACSSTVRAGDS